VADPFDSEKNIAAGAKFLRMMLDRFGTHPWPWRPTTPVPRSWPGAAACRPSPRPCATWNGSWPGRPCCTACSTKGRRKPRPHPPDVSRVPASLEDLRRKPLHVDVGHGRNEALHVGNSGRSRTYWCGPRCARLPDNPRCIDQKPALAGAEQGQGGQVAHPGIFRGVFFVGVVVVRKHAPVNTTPPSPGSGGSDGLFPDVWGPGIFPSAVAKRACRAPFFRTGPTGRRGPREMRVAVHSLSGSGVKSPPDFAAVRW
jgi:hypothetical protein